MVGLRRGQVTIALLAAPAWLIVRGLGLLVRGVRMLAALPKLREATADSVRCGCGAENALYDRFTCMACQGTYRGFAWRCGICGANALWFPCGTCGEAIPRSNPWWG